MAKIRVLNSVGATVIIDGVERESVTVDAGTTVHWKVSKEGYVTQEGDYTVWEDTVLPVVLKREVYTITFNVSPTDATLTVNGSAVALTDGKYTMTAKWGDAVSWSCVAAGYIGQNGNFTATEDRTVDITLKEEAVIVPDRTITFIVSPTDATLTVSGYEVTLSDGVYTMTTNDDDEIDWSCERDGYVSQSGSHTVDGDATITITLEEEETHYITVTPRILVIEGATGGTVTVSCDGSWTVETDSDWIALRPSSGEAGDTSVLVSASVISDETRYGTVTFTSEHGKIAMLSVTQTESGGGSGGGTGGTTYTYTVVNETSEDVRLEFYGETGKAVAAVAVPAKGTAAFTTEEQITADTEYYVDGNITKSYSVRVAGTTIYIEYGTSNSNSDAEAYSEGENG